MRIGDFEREQLFERLSRHAAAGRLDVAELERRIAAVSVAQTHEEAAAVLADLPPLPPSPAASAGLPPPRRRLRLGWKPGHGDAQKAAPDWRPTAERFRDPRTKQVMRVWEDATGTRHYLPDDGS